MSAEIIQGHQPLRLFQPLNITRRHMLHLHSQERQREKKRRLYLRLSAPRFGQQVGYPAKITREYARNGIRVTVGRRSQHYAFGRSEEHTSELQSRPHLVCRLLLEKKNKEKKRP